MFRITGINISTLQAAETTAVEFILHWENISEGQILLGAEIAEFFDVVSFGQIVGVDESG